MVLLKDGLKMELLMAVKKLPPLRGSFVVGLSGHVNY